MIQSKIKMDLIYIQNKSTYRFGVFIHLTCVTLLFIDSVTFLLINSVTLALINS